MASVRLKQSDKAKSLITLLINITGFSINRQEMSRFHNKYEVYYMLDRVTITKDPNRGEARGDLLCLQSMSW